MRLVIAAAVLTTITACGTSTSPSDTDQIDARAAEVMPFDLEKTSHTFTKTDTGGTQIVVALDPADTEQVALIRRHLTVEAERFRRGDYSDPAEIHGMDMPGLDTLTRRFAEIDVTLDEVADGAQVSYEADDGELVEAIHAWFDRQTMDHS